LSPKTAFRSNKAPSPPPSTALEGRGWIEAEWGIADAGRSAKFYRLSTSGRTQLEAKKEHWLSFASAMSSVLNMEELA
jgi:PadR family transcriptional regulator PadR